MKRSIVHKDLRTPKYRMRVVSLKTAYKRKAKNLNEKKYYDLDDHDSKRLHF
jgi:hypothetical protein